MKQKKGYSLIEIVIGLVIIIIFLVGTGSLINASYTNYQLILMRNEAIDFAMREMESVLQSPTVSVSDEGHTEGSMQSRIKIEHVKDGDYEYQNKVFLVTVSVEYAKTSNSEKRYSVELQSLKVVQ